MESHRKATYTEGLYIGEDARLAIALNANYVVQQVKLPTAAMGGISFCHFSGARGQQRHRLCPEQSTGAALVVQPCVWQVKCRVCGAKPHRVLVHVLTSLASNHAGKAGSECKLHHRSRRGGACPHALPCGPVGVADWAACLGLFCPRQRQRLCPVRAFRQASSNLEQDTRLWLEVLTRGRTKQAKCRVSS